MPTVLITGPNVMRDSTILPQWWLEPQPVLTVAYPRSDGSGWVDLGAWFCAQVVYPCKDSHQSKH